MIEYFILLFAVPLGLILAKITNDEKKIYTNLPYFPIFLWVLVFVMIIFYVLDRQIALTLTFIFITTFVWDKY